MLNLRALLVVPMCLERQSKKNHDYPTNKDEGKTFIRGSPAKKKILKQFDPAPSIYLGNTLSFVPSVMVGYFPRIVVEIKRCVSIDDYEHIHQLSPFGKSNLLTESTYHVL